MAAGNRPLRTVQALAKHFGRRWADLTQLEITDNSVKIGFSDRVVPGAAPAATASPFANPEQPDAGPLNDADLALSPPAGMLVPQPLPPDEAN